MKEIIIALIGTIPSIIAVFGTYKATKKASKDSTELLIKTSQNSTMLSIKADLMIIYDKCKDQGYITKFQLELFEELAKNYYAMGGNGFIHKVHDEIKSMELR